MDIFCDIQTDGWTDGRTHTRETIPYVRRERTVLYGTYVGSKTKLFGVKQVINTIMIP